MNSVHQRTVSGTDRRSIHSNGLPSRVNTTRSKDYEQSPTNGNSSPSLSNDGDGANDYRNSKPSLEKRREKKTITTTETFLSRRSPVKDSFQNDVRSRQRQPVHSPTLKRKQGQVENDFAPWAPEVSLIPHSSAPLSCRISAPPISRDAPDTLSGQSLLEADMQEQEQLLLDDLLFVFMGYEGQYIRYAETYNSGNEKDRLAGPIWQVAPGLDPSLRDLIDTMLTMASHYSAIETFIEVQSREEYGSVNHALCAAIRRLAKDYLILVAQLENKILSDSSFTLHQMHLSVIPIAQSLEQLYAVAQELLKKNALLEEDVDESIDEFDADNIIDRLREGGDLLPGSMTQKRCIGGNVLALLTQRLATYSGDPAARSILEMLLREASRPYMIMLNEWLHHGGINDPHSEFLIGERTSIKRERLDEDYIDDYWDKRYHIREKEIPPQLQAVKDKVLLAGKYLNVVRECGGVNITSKIEHTPTTFDDSRFLDNVNHAYAFANAELLNLLLSKNSLRSRLVSIKHYFFLNRAEFFLYFLELSGSELRKPQRSVNVGKLQSLLDIVLHQPGSIAVADPFKEDVKVQMNELGLVPWLMKIVNVQGLDTENPEAFLDQYKPTAPSASDERDISGFDALELDYHVPFPLSLIISRKTITRYQLILRYTISLRHLESMLIESWSEHSKSLSWIHKSSSRRIEVWKRRAWNLRARMLVFVQQMLFYATAEVLEPQWQKLISKVDALELVDESSAEKSSEHFKSRQTVDELMQEHVDMLDSCMKDLGLTQSKILRLHAKMTAGCQMFASYTSNLTRNLYSADSDFAFLHSDPNSAASVRVKQNYQHFSNAAIPPPDPDRMQRIEETLLRHEEYFNRHLKILIDTLNYFAATETVTLLGLCARLTNAEVQKRDELSL